MAAAAIATVADRSVLALARRLLLVTSTPALSLDVCKYSVHLGADAWRRVAASNGAHVLNGAAAHIESDVLVFTYLFVPTRVGGTRWMDGVIVGNCE